MKLRLFKKLLVTMLVTVSILGTGALPVLANTGSYKAVEANGQVDFEPFADVLGIYFRSVNGVLQYRIWNYTRGRWENNWTNVLP